MGLLRVGFALAHRWLLLRGVRSRVSDTAGGKVHWYDVPGRGSHGTLVLQHGIGAEALHYLPMLPMVRRYFGRIVLPDLPGHGRSDPADSLEGTFDGFAAALDEALDRPAVVFGNSLGGAMATRYAIVRPERTRALILASPAGAALAAGRLRALLDNFALPDDAATLAFFARLNPKVRFGASLVAADVRATFARPHLRALIASVREDHAIPAEQVRGLVPPTLLLWGKQDKLMPPEMLAWYREHLPPGALVEEPEDVGHCPQFDRPGWTARRILEFTRSIGER